MTRRSLLVGGLGAMAAGVAGGTYEWRRLRHPSAGDIVRLIERRLGDRNLDPAGVERFAGDFVAHYGASGMAAHHRDSLGGLLTIGAIRRRLSARRGQQLLGFERAMVSFYLRSTDYFRTPPGTLVRYVQLADPYEAVCANPFARLDLE